MIREWFLGIIFLGVLVAISPSVALALRDFIIGGHLPLINVTLSPIVMMLFWALIVPATYLLRRTISAAFWRIIEYIGSIHQRQINHRFRLPRPSRNFTELIIIVMIHEAQKIPAGTPETPELSLRRRFLALQS